MSEVILVVPHDSTVARVAPTQSSSAPSVGTVPSRFGKHSPFAELVAGGNAAPGRATRIERGHDPHLRTDSSEAANPDGTTCPDPTPRVRRVEARAEPDAWESDARDPLARALATPFATGMEEVAAPAAHRISTELEQMLVRLAKRAQWGGDGRRATARIELDSGVGQGAVVTVHALASREVSVDIELPPGSVGDPWSERIKSRLEQRGFSVAEVSVH